MRMNNKDKCEKFGCEFKNESDYEEELDSEMAEDKKSREKGVLIE